MTGESGIWAVIPVKERVGAKQRLSAALSPEQRQAFMACMLEDMLEALVAVPELAGIALVTLDPFATELAARHGARVLTEGARDGHTGAVTAAARVLRAEGCAGMITLPGDIPALATAEVSAVLAVHRPAPSFTIVPAHDEQGSNAIVCSPPDAVPLRFGDDSYFPHLDAARRVGITPTISRQAGIGMDIDHPADLAAFLRMTVPEGRRAREFLVREGLTSAGR